MKLVYCFEIQRTCISSRGLKRIALALVNHYQEIRHYMRFEDNFMQPLMTVKVSEDQLNVANVREFQHILGFLAANPHDVIELSAFTEVSTMIDYLQAR